MRTNMVFWFWMTLSVPFPTQAEQTAYFLDIVDQSAPDEATIAKAIKQLEDLKEVKIHKDLTLQPFHKRRDNQIPESKAYCNGCHLPLPHRKKLRTRAFLNMHTRYVACETCHFRPENQELSYQWLDYTLYEAVKNPAGLLHSGHLKDDMPPLQPRTGLIRIAPFFKDKPVPATQEQNRAKEIYRQWKIADLDAKARIKATIHLPLEEKGPACVSCHDYQNNMLNLVELGANEQQIKAVEHNIIADFFKHYQPDNDSEEKEQRIRITDLLR